MVDKTESIWLFKQILVNALDNYTYCDRLSQMQTNNLIFIFFASLLQKNIFADHFFPQSQNLQILLLQAIHCYLHLDGI